MTTTKAPVWREKRGEFPYYKKSWVARTGGWTLRVSEDVKDWSMEGSGRFRFFAEQSKGDGVYNSAWGKTVWLSLEAAQRAAVKWVRDGAQRPTDA